MQVFFGPAIRLINKLSYAGKLVVVALVFLLPICASLFVIASGYSEQIKVTEVELDGVAYTKPLLSLLRQVQAHRGMMALLLNHREIDQGKIDAARKDIDALITELNRLVSEKHGFEPPADAWKNWQTSWQSLRQQVEQLSPAESFKRHTELAAGVVSLVDRVTDASGLALDPDLDSYYVMLGLQTQLPALAEQMGQARAKGATATADGVVDLAEKIQLQVHKARIDDLDKEFQKDLAIAGDANKEVKDALMRQRAEYLETAKAYQALIDHNFFDNNKDITAAPAYFGAATKAIDALYAVGDVLDHALQQLLHKRIDKISGKRSVAILALLGMSLLGLYVFVAIYLSTSRSLARAVSALERVCKGELDVDVQVDSADEFGRLLQSTRGMVATLQQFSAAQLEMGRSHELGEVDYRINTASYQGVFGDMAMQINSLAQLHIGISQKITEVIADYTHGKYDAAMDRLPGKLAAITSALDKVQAGLAEAARAASENLRIRIALDNVSGNVMIADNERNIVYMNKSVQAMLARNEAAIRKVLPQFDVKRLQGGNMDVFHRNPGHQAALLARLSSAYRSDIRVSDLHFRLTANPVMDAAGNRLGSVVEWQDRTDEVKSEQDIAQLVEAAALGDFDTRINESGKEGFFLQVAQGLNQLLSTSAAGMAEIKRVLNALAVGNLNERIEGEFAGIFAEMKDAANATSDRLREIVLQISEAADSITTATAEIASGNQNLSSRTEQQAASLEETASSVEELTGTVRQTAENARQANQLSIGASDVAKRGGEVVGQVVTTMSEINESSRKIVDIISVIDGIAFQTNILALNAAVEAARAGEQGRGFAVVASEVRNLAQRSAAAAKEIKGLISDSVEKVDSGTRLVDQAGQTMQDIVNAVRRVTDLMSEITAATQEQSHGIEQVNETVTNLDDMTQQNAALVEQAAAAAESLEEQAQNLVGAISAFQLGQQTQVRRTTARLAAPAAARQVGAPSFKPLSLPAASESEDWEEF